MAMKAELDNPEWVKHREKMWQRYYEVMSDEFRKKDIMLHKPFYMGEPHEMHDDDWWFENTEIGPPSPGISPYQNVEIWQKLAQEQFDRSIIYAKKRNRPINQALIEDKIKRTVQENYGYKGSYYSAGWDVHTQLERFYHFVGDEYRYKGFSMFGHECAEHPILAEHLFTHWAHKIWGVLRYPNREDDAVKDNKWVLTTDYILKALAEDPRVDPELNKQRFDATWFIGRIFHLVGLNPENIARVINLDEASVDDFLASDRPGLLPVLLDSVENYAPDYLKEMVDTVVSGKSDPRFVMDD